MAGITFELEYPNPKLSPNARTHYRPKAVATAAARALARISAINAGASKIEKDRIQVRVDFYPSTRRRRDEDNVIGAFKAYRDGIADALGVDDSDIEFRYKLHREPVKGGATKIMINSGCTTCIECGQELPS